jgi:hypothetical protein
MPFFYIIEIKIHFVFQVCLFLTKQRLPLTMTTFGLFVGGLILFKTSDLARCYEYFTYELAFDCLYVFGFLLNNRCHPEV